jgi:beta-glucosidase
VGVDSSPLFAFGHGLSYTTFRYDPPSVNILATGSADDVEISTRVTNTGGRDGDEVAQLYVRQTTASVATPVKSLKGFLRIHLRAGESQTVSFRIKESEFAVWNANGEWKVEPGQFTFGIGGSSEVALTSTFTLK